jgi:hypothetical protein
MELPLNDHALIYMYCMVLLEDEKGGRIMEWKRSAAATLYAVRGEHQQQVAGFAGCFSDCYHDCRVVLRRVRGDLYRRRLRKSARRHVLCCSRSSRSLPRWVLVYSH